MRFDLSPAMALALVGLTAMVSACARATPTGPPAPAAPTPIAVIGVIVTEAASARTVVAIPADAPRPTAADPCWVKARTAQGLEGWFEVRPYDDVILDGRPVPAGLVFEGMSAAD